MWESLANTANSRYTCLRIKSKPLWLRQPALAHGAPNDVMPFKA